MPVDPTAIVVFSASRPALPAPASPASFRASAAAAATSSFDFQISNIFFTCSPVGASDAIRSVAMGQNAPGSFARG